MFLIVAFEKIYYNQHHLIVRQVTETMPLPLRHKPVVLGLSLALPVDC